MIAETISLLRLEGLSAVSVSRIAKRVGVHHSLFYAHFKNLDACLAAAAQHVLEALAPVDRDLRREMLERAVTDRQKLAHYFESAFARWLEQRTVVELLLAHRLDHSKIGEALRPALGMMRDGLTADLWDLAAAIGVDGKHIPEVRALADLHLAHWLWALENLLEGRMHDRAALASMLADLFVSTNMTFFARATRPSRSELWNTHFSQEQRAALADQKALLRHWLETGSENELIARAGGAEQLVDQVLGALTQYFVPAAARGASAIAVYRIEHASGTVVRRLVVRNGQCTIDADCDAEPARITLTQSLRSLLETHSGLRHFDEAYRKHEIRIEGDLFFAIELLDWFYVP
jgi:AcrR family transcriptional regulator